VARPAPLAHAERARAGRYPQFVSSYEAWPFLSDPAHPFLSALWAVLIRGIVALVAVAPLLRASRHPLGYTALAFAGGSLIDLDHFVAAGSLDLHTIETMGDRPDTHSLLFVALVGLLVLALTRRPLVAWPVFAIGLSHLLFDGAGGHEPVLYPLRSVDGLPWLACPLGTLALCGLSAWIARHGRRSRAMLPRPAEDRPVTVLDAG